MPFLTAKKRLRIADPKGDSHVAAFRWTARATRVSHQLTPNSLSLTPFQSPFCTFPVPQMPGSRDQDGLRQFLPRAVARAERCTTENLSCSPHKVGTSGTTIQKNTQIQGNSTKDSCSRVSEAESCVGTRTCRKAVGNVGQALLRNANLRIPGYGLILATAFHSDSV